MNLRHRLILSTFFLALISLAGATTIIMNLRTLVRNQDMITFKDTIFHQYGRAREMIQSSQSLLYQHQAGYTRDIDPLVNNIIAFDTILKEIPQTYRENYRDRDCAHCHPGGRRIVESLAKILHDLQFKIQRYQESVSILVTTNDQNTRIMHHGFANAIGEEILNTIEQVNHNAELMINQLRSSNNQLLYRSEVTIEASIAGVAILFIIIVSYILYISHHLLSSLIRGTESIARDDFSLRLPMAKKKDELGLIASRFNLMAEHLQERDQEIQVKTLEVEEANRQLRDLNENLEKRIHERTFELENSLEQLQTTTTALRESKRKLEAANLDLIKANQAKSNFLSIVSHELKTPLSVINGFLSLILDERYHDDSKNLMEAVQISKRRGEQLSRMIDELIDLSRLDAKALVLKKEPVAVEKALREAAEQFREDLQQRQLRFISSLPPGLPPLVCDPDKLRQVFTNLISNALKFSQEGGEIELGCEERGENFLFFCRDTGIGIPPDETEKIFEKFYQVDSSSTRRYGGSGLGLSIVREIVLLHGGKIWVESELSKGSTFFFTIPKGVALEQPSPPVVPLTQP